MNGEKGYNCENVGNLSDIFSLARSMDISLLTDDKKLKTKRTLCAEINMKQDGFQWLNSVAAGQKPYYDEDSGQTMIFIAFDYFVDAFPQPAIDYIYIDHTEGQPFQKDGQRFIKVFWDGFAEATDEPVKNIKRVYKKEKISKDNSGVEYVDEAMERRNRISAEVEQQFKISEETEKKATEKREMEKRKMEKREMEKREMEKREMEKREAEKREAEKKEMEKREAEKKEAERKDAERKEAERKEVERKEIEKREEEKKRRAEEQAKKDEARRLQQEEEGKQKLVEEEKRIELEKKRRVEEELERRYVRQKEQERRDKEDAERKQRQQQKTDQPEAKRPRILEPVSVSQHKSDYQRLERPTVESGNRQIIAGAVYPCPVAQVDRPCLTGDRNPYVVQTIDVAKFGELGDKLGHGSFGQVFKTTKNYAVKCLRGRSNRPTELRDNDVREMCLLRNLIHPNIIAVYQVAIATATDKELCFNAAVLQLYDSSLADVSVQGRRHAKLRCYIMFQVVRAVAFIHSRNIWHRDIKPHNFLINTNTNQIVITDFGSAQGLAVAGNRYTKIVSTAWFRAPEIFLGSSRYTSSIDIWSLGITWLYLVNFEEFKKNTDEQILNAIYKIAGYPSETNYPLALKLPNYSVPITNERFAMPTILKNDKEMDDTEIYLVMQMLQLDPEKRINAFDAMANNYFDPVRAQVQRTYPGPNIVPPSLVNCGAVLVAMQTQPVRDYLTDNEDKQVLMKAFEWSLRIVKENQYRPSLFSLTTALAHRYLNKKYDTRFFKIIAACMQIAWKIDADYETKTVFSQRVSLPYLQKQGVTVQLDELGGLENDILRTLDMDLDRPTAFTFIEFLASYNIIGDQVYKSAVSALSHLEVSLGTLNKTALQVALFVLRQQSVDSNCKKMIESIFPDMIK